MSDLALILFDVDGTLVNSQAHILSAMAETFNKTGLPQPDPSQIMAGIGLSLPILMHRLVPTATPEQIDQLVENYKGAFVTLKSANNPEGLSPLYPGAKACLKELAQRDTWLLGTATGKSRRGLDHMINRHNWQQTFVTLQCADDHPSKPHPSMVLTAMAETGVGPERTVVIGDTTFDMEMARSAGTRAIGVSWGYHPSERLVEAGAFTVIDSFDVLPNLLAELLE